MSEQTTDPQNTKVILEYIGPANQEWNDGEKHVQLVAGRRYQIPADVAEHWLRQSPNHWKRPDAPTGERAAAKE